MMFRINWSIVAGLMAGIAVYRLGWASLLAVPILLLPVVIDLFNQRMRERTERDYDEKGGTQSCLDR
jgi:hypothetical protein